MPIKLITTEDGSHSLFHEELNETYHSTKGARGESEHVFIKEGLEFLVSTGLKKVNILEVGLGTGLNAFLTALFAKKNEISVSYTTLEPYPIVENLYNQLNYYDTEAEKELLLDIHHADWEKETQLSSYFTLFKQEVQLEYFTTQNIFQLIYFDAFAPSKQPEVWSLENLKKCYELLEPGGVLTTYCAQGQFKRNLVESGYKVETLRGAMGKKEMVRGVKS